MPGDVVFLFVLPLQVLHGKAEQWTPIPAIAGCADACTKSAPDN
jgi:hypothetical protein